AELYFHKLLYRIGWVHGRIEFDSCRKRSFQHFTRQAIGIVGGLDGISSFFGVITHLDQGGCQDDECNSLNNNFRPFASIVSLLGCGAIFIGTWQRHFGDGFRWIAWDAAGIICVAWGWYFF